MRKQPDDHLIRQARIAQSRLQSYLRKKRRKNRKISPAPLASLLSRDMFYLPEKCTFATDSIDACIENLVEMREQLKSGKRLLLDFSFTQSISATYGVYFYAELQSLIEEFSPGCVYINLQSLSPRHRFIVKESGLLRLTNNIPLSAGKKGFLPILSGTKDDKIDAIINYIISIAETNGHISSDTKSRAQAELLTSRAITEAMLNVDYHAYPDITDEKLWWFTALIYENDLYISLCDRGVGIHKTLPRAEWWEHVMGALQINDDAQMIQAAMAYTRSSNKTKRGRGLGTKDMQNLVLERKKGFMTIVSGRGHYTLDANKNGKETLFKTNHPITGTAINWRIPLGHTK